MRKRTRYSLLLMLSLVAALVVAVLLRKAAPPEAARLLPESDAILYVNLKPVRAVTHFDRTAVPRSADYQHFIDATGIDPERDLDAAAFALHRMDNPNGPNGPVAYSEVFEGRFDGARVARYLSGIAASQEDYEGHTVFTIPIEGRQLRIAQLGYDTIAASNMPTAEQIHSMLDRYRAAASPFSGSSLLAARYRDVPLLSSAWGIGRIGLPFSEHGRIAISGFELPLSADSTFVASVRPGVGGLHLRVEELAPSEGDAAQTTAALGPLIELIQAVPVNVTADSDKAEADALRALTTSMKIEQHKDRVVLTASVPLGVLKKLATPAAASGPSGSGLDANPANPAGR
jgi:hypothetical protein